MVTRERKYNKKCLFCVSDYHLEMILVPYIIKEEKNTQFIVFTENNLEPTIRILLSKLNINEENKEIIKRINWNRNDFFDYKQIENLNNNKNIIIINGSNKYIKNINKKLKEGVNRDIEIIDCFHLEDKEVDIEEISKNYESVLNTKKI